ncbi:MAG: class II glutamine amidotransferase [Planctomycetes bacterium]|nr:class II glutamine amidotransferase [Planctomycetota bacterium]
MCRWIAYVGDPINLDDLLLKPQNSMVGQSQHAQRSLYTVNGDGFGVGWYTGTRTPGLFRDVLPAWNDENLREIAAHVRSGLFLAHVRASSGSPIQRTNCHPFRHDNWLFQHNGQIEDFGRLRRRIDLEISPDLYSSLDGTTDSERIFYLALSLGLADDPSGSLARTVFRIEALAREEDIKAPLSMTAALTDGSRLFAVRYASNGDAPSLFHSLNLHALRECHGGSERFPGKGCVILSEPLDDVSQHWTEVPNGTFLTIEEGRVSSSAFVPGEH